MRNLSLFFLILIPIFSFGQTINFNDSNFESILLSATTSNNIAKNELNESIAIDNNENGLIEVEESALVFELHIPINSNIENLLGIESFSNLNSLHCTYNLLSELNVSMLQNLKFLNVENNLIETLEFNPQLETLSCSNNEIETLDFSLSASLKNLNCAYNNLTELNLLNAINLKTLNCSDNQLSDLMIQSLPLININCNNNQLVELDLLNVGDSSSGTPLIIDCLNNDLLSIDTTLTENSAVNLNCSDNANLISLYLKNGETFYDSAPPQPPSSAVYFHNNFNLQIICADAFNFNYLQTKLDNNTILGCELTSDCTLGINGFKEEEFTFFPNPIKNHLTIECPINFNTLIIYNFLGQIVYKTDFNPNEPIELEFLDSGNYIGKIISENGSKQIRITKE